MLHTEVKKKMLTQFHESSYLSIACDASFLLLFKDLIMLFNFIVSAWEDIGCYKDTSSQPRAMTGERNDYPGILTRAMCLETCTSSVSEYIYIPIYYK